VVCFTVRTSWTVGIVELNMFVELVPLLLPSPDGAAFMLKISFTNVLYYNELEYKDNT